jgi:hypothetical protein
VDLSLLELALSPLHALATGSLRDSPDPSTGLLPPGLLPPGLQDKPQEEAGDLMYPPSLIATPSCSSSSSAGAPVAADHPALLSHLEDDGDLWFQLLIPFSIEQLML